MLIIMGKCTSRHLFRYGGLSSVSLFWLTFTVRSIILFQANALIFKSFNAHCDLSTNAVVLAWIRVTWVNLWNRRNEGMFNFVMRYFYTIHNWCYLGARSRRSLLKLLQSKVCLTQSNKVQVH